jgi:hypothetical protein
LRTLPGALFSSYIGMVIAHASLRRFVHYGHIMSDIPGNQEILALVDEINKPE